MEDGCEWGPARRPVNVRELSRGLSAAGRQIAPQIPYCIKYLFHQEFNINFWVIVRENVWINLWRLDSHCTNRPTRMKPWFSAYQLMIVVPSIIHHNGQMHLGLLHIPRSDLKKSIHCQIEIEKKKLCSLHEMACNALILASSQSSFSSILSKTGSKSSLGTLSWQ